MCVCLIADGKFICGVTSICCRGHLVVQMKTACGHILNILPFPVVFCHCNTECEKMKPQKMIKSSENAVLPKAECTQVWIHLHIIALRPSLVLFFMGYFCDMQTLLSQCSWSKKMRHYVQIFPVTGNNHTYAHFKCRILPPVWSVFIWGHMKIGKIQEIIGATTWQFSMQPATSGSREHSFAYIITAEALDCWHSAPTFCTGCQTAPSVRWQQRGKLCTLVCLHS